MRSPLKRCKGKNVSLFQGGVTNGFLNVEMYLLYKYKRRGCLSIMRYGNKILRKNLNIIYIIFLYGFQNLHAW